MKLVLSSVPSVVLAVLSVPAFAQSDPMESLSACAPTIGDFGPCLTVLVSHSKAIAAEKSGLEPTDPRLAVLTEYEARTANALSAFTDLSGRTAKLRGVEKEQIAAEKRRDAAQDRDIRAYEQLLVDERSRERTALEQALTTVRAGAFRYATAALSTPLANRSETVVRSRGPAAFSCRDMIDKPDVSFDVGDCAAGAIRQSASVLPGGEIKVPGSVLNPPGFSALLAGGETGGSVALTLSKEIKARRYSGNTGSPSDPVVQRVATFGSSIGLKAGDGMLFSRDTTLQNSDQIDNRAALTASLFANFFSSEKKSQWTKRATALTVAARAACLADQQAEKPARTSSCEGESLTNWVYALSAAGERLNKKVADQADALYFGGPSAIPRFGFGINAEIARSSFEYLLPSRFTTFFSGNFNDTAFKAAAFQRSSSWVASISPYAYLRLTKADAKVGVSLIPSYTIGTTLGYANGYEKPLFCPPIATGAPFTTSSCKRFYAAAPAFAQVETWSLEMRSAFPIWGDIDLIASPKISRNDKDRTLNHPWLVSMPVLAFTDLGKTSAVGFKVDWAFGQVNAAGVAEDDDLVVKLVYQKAFSLTGK